MSHANNILNMHSTRGIKDVNQSFLQKTTLYNGDYFGEAAFIENVPHAATISVKEECRVLVLFREDFNIKFAGNLPFRKLERIIFCLLLAECVAQGEVYTKN